MDAYTAWLGESGVRLYTGGGLSWRLYQGALVPSSVYPVYVNLSNDEALKLISDSKALFIRYTSHPTEKETPWWYMVCDRYDVNKLSSNMRNQIKKGKKACSVEKISAQRLAETGYECYRSAFRRYQGVVPASEEVFKRGILDTAGSDIFHYWGVYVNSTLAGYCQCIVDVETKQVATNVIKYHPDF
jgi:hypothetical protein